MNLNSYLMVRCIVQDKKNIEKHLFDILNNHIQKFFPGAMISIKFDALYWKIPDNREIIYNISHTQPITVTDFIGHFNIAWHCFKGKVFDVDKQQSVYEEDAVWSLLCNPTEQFLSPEVEWANVYTWD